MRMSVWSEYFHGPALAEKVRAFLDCGVAVSELSDEDGTALLEAYGPSRAAQAGQAVRDLCAEYGFAFPQGHLWLRANLCADDTQGIIETLKPWLELYLAAGIPRGVLHGGHNPEISEEEMGERRLKVLRALCEYLQGTQLMICIENIPRSALWGSEGLLTLLRDAESPNLGICLDTGHLHLTPEPQYDFITRCGPRLQALHIADNEGERDQHLMPFGRGSVDWAGVLRGLREIGYQGPFNYEIPGETRCPPEILKSKLRYLKEVTEYLFALPGA